MYREVNIQVTTGATTSIFTQNTFSGKENDIPSPDSIQRPYRENLQLPGARTKAKSSKLGGEGHDGV
jgi:hypothetical protein